MKKNKNLFVCLMLAGILLVSVLIGTVAARRQETPASKELTVVTSFYPMYIAAENVIGDATDVRLENLSEPQTGCLHDFQLTPEDMKLLSTADVFIINGGGIESFMKDVAELIRILRSLRPVRMYSFLPRGTTKMHMHG